MQDARRFNLAPMAMPFKIISMVYALLSLALLSGHLGGAMGQTVGIFVTLIAGIIWLWFKPTAFVIGGGSLTLKWPLRSRVIPLGDIVSAELVHTRDLGYMIRIGAGGLWGAFGLFKTGKQGMINGYFSALEGLVLLKLKNSRPLLISPENSPDFMRALGF